MLWVYCYRFNMKKLAVQWLTGVWPCCVGLVIRSTRSSAETGWCAAMLWGVLPYVQHDEVSSSAMDSWSGHAVRMLLHGVKHEEVSSSSMDSWCHAGCVLLHGVQHEEVSSRDWLVCGHAGCVVQHEKVSRRAMNGQCVAMLWMCPTWRSEPLFNGWLVCGHAGGLLLHVVQHEEVSSYSMDGGCAAMLGVLFNLKLAPVQWLAGVQPCWGCVAPCCSTWRS